MIYQIGDSITIEELTDTPLKESQRIIFDSSQYKEDPFKYYQKHFQTKKITHPSLGEIYFGRKGNKETKTKGPKKYQALLCIIDRLIMTGYCNGKMESPKHPRNDSIVGFYIIENEVEYDTIPLRIKITICVDSQGNKYYLFNTKKINESLPMSPVDRSEKNVYQVEQAINIITESQEKVNLDLKELNEKLEKYFEE